MLTIIFVVILMDILTAVWIEAVKKLNEREVKIKDKLVFLIIYLIGIPLAPLGICYYVLFDVLLPEEDEES